MIDLPSLDLPLIFRKFGLHPSKGLGQNFLNDDQVLQNIVRIAHVMPADNILEIGPGLGSLTRYLALAAHSVTAIELDEHLFPALKDILSPYPNVRLVHGDILDFDPANLVGAPDYLVVANIPYYITSAVIRRLLESPHRPRRIVLTLQEEVAVRICALPGNMSLLALSVQVFGKPRLCTHIPAQAFFPPPKVNSAVISIDVFTEPAIPVSLLDIFFTLAKAGFSQKRKMLRNSISAGMQITPGKAEKLLTAAGIDPQRRAETLNLEEWGRICNQFSTQLESS